MKSTLALTAVCLVSMLSASRCFAAVQVNNKTVIHISTFVPCAAAGIGETVDLSGPLHTLVSYTINGNRVSGAFHVQPQGITGRGESTGEKYQGTGVTEQTFTGSFRNAQNTNSFVNNFRIIGQGAHNNFLLHETMHIVINADGMATVNHDNISIDCK